MDPRYSAQDVLRCTLCKTAAAVKFCDYCIVHLCNNCVENHRFTENGTDFRECSIVPLQKFLSSLKYPNCSYHSARQSKLHCKRCDVSICTICEHGQHQGHRHEDIDIIQYYQSKHEAVKKDLTELETSIYPRFKGMATFVSSQKTFLWENSENFSTDLEKQREVWYKEVDAIIKRMQTDFDNMNSDNLETIYKQEKKIENTIKEVSLLIQNLRSLLKSRDVSLVYDYKSRNKQLNDFTAELEFSFPDLQVQEINLEQLTEQFGPSSTRSSELERGLHMQPRSESRYDNFKKHRQLFNSLY